MKYLVTGGAGFIGSNIVNKLIVLNQEVVVIDNLSNGNKQNIAELNKVVFVEDDIRMVDLSMTCFKNIDFILHQAARCSVPQSLINPHEYIDTNVIGTIHMLELARMYDVKKFIFASSSSVYGNRQTDHFLGAKDENSILSPENPYAVSKMSAEFCVKNCGLIYKTPYIILRYFNVFGERQRKDSIYSAVIPKFINNILKGVPSKIFGDGKQIRDFVFVDDVVGINIKACESCIDNGIYNIAGGISVTINELLGIIGDQITTYHHQPIYKSKREGDIYNSKAIIDKARHLLNFEPYKNTNFEDCIERVVNWYKNEL